MKKKTTVLQQLYQKELKRINRFIKNTEKRGFRFDEYKLPTTPKRVTKQSLAKIQATRPKQLYEKSYAITVYGEKLTGAEARKLERKIASDKAKLTRERKKASKNTPLVEVYNYFPSEESMIINNFKANLTLFPTFAQPVLSNWLNNILAQQGKKATAEMLKRGADNGLLVTWEVAYKDGMLQQFMSEMLDYLPDLGVLEREQLTDAFEYEESWDSPD